jgi:hypothetical protein
MADWQEDTLLSKMSVPTSRVLLTEGAGNEFKKIKSWTAEKRASN